MIPWPPEAVLAVAIAGRQRLNALTPHFLDPSLSSPLPFQHVPAPAGKAVSAGRSTGTACGLSSVCLISVIDDSRTSMSKLTVLKYGQRCRQLCQEHVITVVKLAGGTAESVPDKRVALEVSNKPWLFSAGIGRNIDTNFA